MEKTVSVAMATYNGKKYIKKQIESIIDNLGQDDELVISDDGSKDGTIDIIKSYMQKDKRICLITGPKRGIKKNFENAIKHCGGKYIFLADQDDYWYKNKVKKVLEEFKKEGVLLVQHDCRIVNVSTNEVVEPSFFAFRKCGPGVLKNIYKTTYIGCCLAFDSCLKSKILPIPNDIDMHDQWIGILANHFGKCAYVKEILMDYHRHENNVSDCFHHYPLFRMIKNRLIFIYRYIKRII